MEEIFPLAVEAPVEAWEPLLPLLPEESRRRPASAGSGARRVRPSLAPPSQILPQDPTLFGWLSRRFAPGEVTLWVGSSRTVDELLELLYVASALAGGRISLLESANRFHPYRVGERARGFGVDPDDVLTRIRLARAFTAYQLVALVDSWATEIRRRLPTLLVLHGVADLLASEEVPAEEREPLFRHVAETLRTLVRSVSRPLLLTCPRGLAEFPGLREHGPPLFDFMRCLAYPDRWVLDAFRDGSRLVAVDRRPGQYGLEEFVPAATEEVIQWAVRSPRTVKRSKSG